MNKSEELIQKASKQEMSPVEKMIENAMPGLEKLMNGDGNAAARFARIITTDMRMNPELAQCTPLSILGAVFTSAELNLEPVAGRAYLLPFNNKKKIGQEWKSVKECQFILGYRGIVELFYRHQSSESLSWGVVHEADTFDFEKGSNAFVKHKEALKDRGEKVAFWVGAYVNSRFLFEVMSYEKCIEHGKQHSKTYNKSKKEFYSSSPWVKSEDSMCLKTCLIQLSKTLPLSVEVQKAIQSDESTRYIEPMDIQSGKVVEVLAEPDQTNWEGDKDDN